MSLKKTQENQIPAHAKVYHYNKLTINFMKRNMEYDELKKRYNKVIFPKASLQFLLLFFNYK